MERIADILKGKVVLAGVGAVGRGDDGFGPLLARRLSGLSSLRALDCEDRLEDYTGDIARENPDTVLIADAVDLGAEPGRFAVLEAESLASFAGGTHDASLAATMRYLERRTGAAVFLIGMQPAVIADQHPLSPAVSAGLEELAAFLRRWSSHLEGTRSPRRERVNHP
jgi:hydrogenase 3 maturation protease